MNLIDEIKSRLARYPELSYTATEKSIEVAPSLPTGFCVGLSIDSHEYTVSFDGWHGHFESAEEALQCFAMGVISGACRIAITYRGATPVRFALEVHEEEQWVCRSVTGLLLQPFWRPKRTCYLMNPARMASGETQT